MFNRKTINAHDKRVEFRLNRQFELFFIIER